MLHFLSLSLIFAATLSADSLDDCAPRAYTGGVGHNGNMVNGRGYLMTRCHSWHNTDRITFTVGRDEETGDGLWDGMTKLACEDHCRADPDCVFYQYTFDGTDCWHFQDGLQTDVKNLPHRDDDLDTGRCDYITHHQNYQVNYFPCKANQNCARDYDGQDCVSCKVNWTGDDCDSCAVNWTGDDCDSCAAGYVADGDDCVVEPICTCANGVAATYPVCDTAVENCASCNDHWTGDTCSICEDGWTGDNCDTLHACHYTGSLGNSHKCCERNGRNCPRGTGDCQNDGDCETGLVCFHNVGIKYGYQNNLVDVCVDSAELVSDIAVDQDLTVCPTGQEFDQVSCLNLPTHDPKYRTGGRADNWAKIGSGCFRNAHNLVYYNLKSADHQKQSNHPLLCRPESSSMQESLTFSMVEPMAASSESFVRSGFALIGFASTIFFAANFIRGRFVGKTYTTILEEAEV